MSYACLWKADWVANLPVKITQKLISRDDLQARINVNATTLFPTTYLGSVELLLLWGDFSNALFSSLNWSSSNITFWPPATFDLPFDTGFNVDDFSFIVFSGLSEGLVAGLLDFVFMDILEKMEDFTKDWVGFSKVFSWGFSEPALVISGLTSVFSVLNTTVGFPVFIWGFSETKPGLSVLIFGFSVITTGLSAFIVGFSVFTAGLSVFIAGFSDLIIGFGELIVLLSVLSAGNLVVVVSGLPFSELPFITFDFASASFNAEVSSSWLF